jgi:membrane dipeptidase
MIDHAQLARRTLLGLTGAALLAPGAAIAARKPAPVLSTYDRAIVIDAQGGFGGYGMGQPGDAPSAEIIEALRTSGVTVVSTTLGDVGNGPNRFRDAVDSIAAMNRTLATQPALLMPILTGADIARAKRENKLGVIYNFQDTTALETDPANIALFRSLGVRVIQLTYNKRNLSGDGCLERADAGLSDLGRQMIAEINDKRVLLDLSHGGRRTVAEAIAASKVSPAITHTGCRALADLPRNTDDAVLKALADKGGVAGVYLMPFLRAGTQPHAEDVVAHLEHMIQVCGEDHVGLGTDGGIAGVKVDAAYREALRKDIEDRRKRGVSAPGENPDVLTLVPEYNTPRRFETLADDLAKRGHSSARIEKILGGNFARLFGEVWGG